MANLLDEVTGPVNEQGQDVNVINRQLPVKVGVGSLIFEIALWVTLPIVAVISWLVTGDTNILLILGLGGMLPGIIFLFMKVSARSYLQQLEQVIQGAASEIDNYLEQRVMILNNVVKLVDRAVDLDKDVMKSVAALRSGSIDENSRADVDQQLTTAFNKFSLQVEAYPELQAHNAIADAMQKNDYLQREITAARTVYNSRVTQWNRDIFAWPTKMIVAARQGYTARIPFSASKETKEAAEDTFESLTKEANIDVEMNKKTCALLYRMQEDLDALKKRLTWWKVLCSALWTVAAACIIQFAIGFSAPVWWLLTIYGLLVVGALVTLFWKVHPIIKQKKQELADIMETVNNLPKEA